MTFGEKKMSKEEKLSKEEKEEMVLHEEVFSKEDEIHQILIERLELPEAIIQRFEDILYYGNLPVLIARVGVLKEQGYGLVR